MASPTASTTPAFAMTAHGKTTTRTWLANSPENVLGSAVPYQEEQAYAECEDFSKRHDILSLGFRRYGYLGNHRGKILTCIGRLFGNVCVDGHDEESAKKGQMCFAPRWRFAAAAVAVLHFGSWHQWLLFHLHDQLPQCSTSSTSIRPNGDVNPNPWLAAKAPPCSHGGLVWTD